MPNSVDRLVRCGVPISGLLAAMYSSSASDNEPASVIASRSIAPESGLRGGLTGSDIGIYRIKIRIHFGPKCIGGLLGRLGGIGRLGSPNQVEHWLPEMGSISIATGANLVEHGFALGAGISFVRSNVLFQAGNGSVKFGDLVLCCRIWALDSIPLQGGNGSVKFCEPVM
jgi:hypothetical protein